MSAELLDRIRTAIASAKDRRFVAVSIDLADAEVLLVRLERPTHCAKCDRPEICDIILRGTAPCKQNAGVVAMVEPLVAARRRKDVA